MTTDEFETAAKNAIIGIAREAYCEEYAYRDISAVWMAHVLGSKKGIFIDSGNRENHRLYEVTYNAAKDEMYADVYTKTRNERLERYETATLVKNIL